MSLASANSLRAHKKSVLAFLLVILQVKGTLISIAQSDLICCQPRGEKWVHLATKSFATASELEMFNSGQAELGGAGCNRHRCLGQEIALECSPSPAGGGGELAPCTCVTVRTWSRWRISSHLSVIQPQHSSSWDSKGRRLGSCGHKTQADKHLCTFCSFFLGGGCEWLCTNPDKQPHAGGLSLGTARSMRGRV